ncbi:hypothetical protein [Bradyrhizobium sp. USDA 4473]
MSKPFAVNETEICIRRLYGKDDFVAHTEWRRHRAWHRQSLKFDAGAVTALHVCVATKAKILSSSCGAIVESSTAVPVTFEIPFH